jgi:alanine racemase
VQVVVIPVQQHGSARGAHAGVALGPNRRSGCELHEAPGLAQYIFHSALARLEGVSSHLATAESPQPDEAKQQVEKFVAFTQRINAEAAGVIRHIANSAGAIYLPESHLDMVRVGLAMYGHSPRGPEPAPVGLTPIVSVRARVSQVKEVNAGTRVGYGLTWTARKATRLALVPVGYADGMPRTLSNRGHVLIRGLPCPIVGRISMDQTVVDAGDIPVEPAEEVVLLGGRGVQAISVERWAELDQSISYEVLCGLGQRLPRVYYR